MSEITDTDGIHLFFCFNSSHSLLPSSGMIRVGLEEAEEEVTAAGWRRPEMTETGPNQLHETNDLNSESGLIWFILI